jgi:RHS repeat-associated protein
MRLVRSFAFFYFIVIVISSPLATCQNPGTGQYSFANLDQFGFDSVNPGNLNTHFVIPIVSKAGRGVPFQYSLAYDGLIWSPVASGSSNVWQPDASFGLHGYLLNDGYKGFLSYSNVSRKCFDDPDNPGYWEWMPIISKFAYHDEYGAVHSINYSDNFCTGVTSGDGSTSDGSGFKMDVNTYVVHSPSGLALALPTYVNGTPDTFNATIEDSNGNEVQNNQNGTFTDTMGMTALTTSGSGTASSPKVFQYKTVGGGAANVTVSYTTKAVKTSFGCSGVSEFGPQNIDLPTTITLGDGQSTYQITYELNGSYVTGRISSVKLPTGGTIYYSYSGVNCTDGSPLGLSRHTSNSSDGTTSYSRSSVSSTYSHTEIIGPHDDATEIDYVYVSGVPYETTRKVYSGHQSGGTLLAQTDTCYNGHAQTGCTSQSLSQPFTQVSIYKTIGGQVTGSDTFYSSNQLVTDVKEYGFGSGSRGSLVRETTYSYAILGQYLTDRVASVQQFDGNQSLYAKTTYGYDESQPTGTSGLPQHVAVSGPRGNLTSIHSWKSSSATIDTYFTVEDTGQTLTTYGTNPGTTTFGYDSGTHTLLTSITPTAPNGISLASTFNYDSYTGLLVWAKDANQNQTSYQYDAMLRRTQTDYPDTGKTTATYTRAQGSSPAQISTNVYQTASTWMDSETQYDAFGRQSRVAVAKGQGTNLWYQTDVCPNQSALTSFTSYSYQGNGFGSGAVCAGTGGDLATYDPLGRVTQVSHGDGSSISYSYNGRATKVTDENGVSRISQVDGLGRITAVCEISSNTLEGVSPSPCGLDIDGTGFLTTYSYSLTGHSTTVNQGGMTRTFQSDWLGRPTSLQEAESGTTTYGYAYNSTGLVVTRQKPRANQASSSVLTTTTTQYDALGRVLSITYDDGTPNLYFSYDVAPGWMPGLTNIAGRLVEAKNQYAGSSGSTSASSIVNKYDAMGRLVRQWQQTPSVSPGGRFVYQSYDLAGNVQTATDGGSVTATYSVSPANQLLSLTSSLNNSTLVSSVANGPSGPLSFNLGNGLSATYSYDSMGRISGGSVNSGGTQVYGFTSGWKGGQLLGSCDTVLNHCATFGYDEFNRLSSQTVTSGTVQNFSWQYDRWGNRTKQIVTAGENGPQPQYSFNINTYKNQISAFTYDAAGNVTGDGINTYTYDAEGNVITSAGSGHAASYTYDALNHRIRTVVDGLATEYMYNLSGQRDSEWNASTQAQLKGHYYWGGAPVAFYTTASGGGAAVHFEHQDWLGTERVRTSYNGGVEGTYTSLPWGDSKTSSGTDQDAYHYAMLDYDSETNTDHAQFRQYSNLSGRWMSPDPFAGSYDFADPQSLNRYTYSGSNPVGSVDPSGLMMDPRGGDGGGGGWGWEGGGFCFLFWCWGGDSGAPSPPKPEFKGYKDLDPDKIMNEHLGLPQWMKLRTGGILDIFGIGYGGGCEFGACGDIGNSFMQGGAISTAAGWCGENPGTCALGADLVAFFSKAIPIVAASAKLLTMTGDADPSQIKCHERRDAEEARCWAKYGYGGKYGNNNQRNACLQRVEWRWNACLRGIPDPGPPLAELKSISPTELDDLKLLSANPIDSSMRMEVNHGGL